MSTHAGITVGVGQPTGHRSFYICPHPAPFEMVPRGNPEQSSQQGRAAEGFLLDGRGGSVCNFYKLPFKEASLLHSSSILLPSMWILTTGNQGLPLDCEVTQGTEATQAAEQKGRKDPSRGTIPALNGPGLHVDVARSPSILLQSPLIFCVAQPQLHLNQSLHYPSRSRHRDTVFSCWESLPIARGQWMSSLTL